MKWPFFALFLLFLGLGNAQDTGPRKVRLPQVLNEVSGLYIQSSDSLWWHNDSGGKAALYLTNRNGELSSVINIPAAENKDWEDLTYDTNGNVYIGDFGNNRRQRNDLRIYRHKLQTQQTEIIQFTYPQEKQYDVEAFLWFQDSLHLFTKSRISRADLTTYHFVIPAQAGLHQAILRDSLQLRKRAVTAAAVDHTSGRMVLLAYYYTKRLGFVPYSAANVYCFESSSQGRWFQQPMRSRRISFLVATQYESVDFLNPNQILVASEQTLFIKAKAKRVKWKGK
ncbi:MAG: hypothetical protein AAGJ93_08195 [Bacteroidota bacterium]